MSFNANPAMISFLGSGIIAPVKNIRMKSGKLPTIITIVALLQNDTRIRQIAMIERIVNEHTNKINMVEPWLLNPRRIASHIVSPKDKTPINHCTKVFPKR